MSNGYQGYLYGPGGQQIFPTPRESPGRYRPRPMLSRYVTRSISQYDHAEAVSLCTSLCCRVPALRTSIRDKNAWSFSNWLPISLSEDDAWAEAAEEHLVNEVLPYALMQELRTDYTWGMRVSGMGLDMHGDDLAVFTEDEQHNPRILFVPAPRIGTGIAGMGWVASLFSGSYTGARADGMGVVNEGQYRDLPIYNGLIRRNNRPIAARVLGIDDQGNPTWNDIPLGPGQGTHYACEMEFMGQGRGLPRPLAALLHFMAKEDTDDQLRKGIQNASERMVTHKLAPGQDAAQARGNAVVLHQSHVPSYGPDGTPELDSGGNQKTHLKDFYVERTPDGEIAYLGSEEFLEGLSFANPHENVEAYQTRVLTECLAEVGWSWALIDTGSGGRAPTRLEAEKANNSIASRQSIQEIRSIRFFQYAIAKGMANGRLKKNSNGLDPYKWGIGFPAQMSVDLGNDVKAAISRLKMGMTNERIEAAKEGYVAKHILRQREKEIQAITLATDRALKFAKSMGHSDITFAMAREWFCSMFPNSAAINKVQEDVDNPEQTAAGRKPAGKKDDES